MFVCFREGCSNLLRFSSVSLVQPDENGNMQTLHKRNPSFRPRVAWLFKVSTHTICRWHESVHTPSQTNPMLSLLVTGMADHVLSVWWKSGGTTYSQMGSWLMLFKHGLVYA